MVALEDDVRSDGVGVGVDRLCRLGGRGVVVHAYVAEVVAHPGLHVGAYVRLERAAAGADHVVDRRALLLHQRGHAGVADAALQAEDVLGAQHILSSGGGGLAGVALRTRRRSAMPSGGATRRAPRTGARA